MINSECVEILVQIISSGISKIQHVIRSEKLVKLLKLNKCSLINTLDLCPFYAHSGSSSSVIDFTLANTKIENAIKNWSIDENAVTGSDHEVFDLN